MKKTAIIIGFLFFSLLVFSQTENQKLDEKLFGTWTGSEKDGQENGMTKNWIMHRFIDGTFVLLFTTVKGEKINNFAEKGKWWVDDKGVFYEYHNNSQMTDTYTYKVLDENNVKFIAKKMNVEMNVDNYEFIDTKVDDGV